MRSCCLIDTEFQLEKMEVLFHMEYGTFQMDIGDGCRAM